MMITTRNLVAGIVLISTLAVGAFAGSQGEAAAEGGIPTLYVTTHSGTSSAVQPASNDLPVYQELENQLWQKS